MPNINYQNASADPRGTWEPQGFLAGINYQDRLNDFSKQRDLANTQTQLSNEGTAARNQDYLAESPARLSEYAQRAGAANNATALQPGQLNLAQQNLQGDIASAPGQNELKVWQSMQALPQAKKEQALKDTLTTATVLRGLPQDSDPNLAIGILDKIGIDTSRWKGKDPARVKKELQFMRSLDTETFKQFHETEKQNALIKSNEKIHKGNNDTSIAVANIMAQSRERALANTSTARNDRMDAIAQSILKNPPNEWSPEEQAFMTTYQIRTNEANYKGGATATSKGDSIKESMKALKNLNDPTPPNTLPRTQSNGLSAKPSSGIADPSAAEYDAMPDGTTYTYRGQTFTKGKR